MGRDGNFHNPRWRTPAASDVRGCVLANPGDSAMIARMNEPDDRSELLQTSLSLLSRLRDSGNSAGWQRFYDTYSRLLFSVAKRSGLSGAEVQDVVQETLIDVAGQMPGFRYDPARGSFKGWLLLIVRRRIADHFRRKHYQFGGERVARESPIEPQSAGQHAMAESEIDRVWAEEWNQHILQAALARVKEEVEPLQFQMFHLHVVKEVPAEEVAERLGVRASAVYWAKYRVGGRVKRVLREIEHR